MSTHRVEISQIPDVEMVPGGQVWSFVNPNYISVVERCHDMFDEKLTELRRTSNNKGRYLIGSFNKPWTAPNFSMGKEQDYLSAGQNRTEDQIVMGDVI